MDQAAQPQYILIPIEKLSDEALSGLIDEFILREGTDYGAKEFTLAEKHTQIRRQIEKGKTLVVFDPIEQSASLMKSEQFKPVEFKDSFKKFDVTE